MKKKLLYLGCPYLGENLFGTPCMELLSKEYDITLVTPRWTTSLFKEYPFISNVIASDGIRNTFVENVRLHMSSLQQIDHVFSDRSNAYYISQHDTDVKMFRAYNMDYFVALPTIEDKELSSTISRTRKYLTKMKLMDNIDPTTFDFTIRVPSYNIPDQSSGDIVICQGSNDKLRRLTPGTIYNFTKAVPNAIYLVEKNIARLLDFDERKIRYIVTSPSEDINLKRMISLFQSKPKVLISPDTGPVHLALGYKVPVIWLESRLRMETIIDYQYKDLVTLYTKKQVFCKQECNARMFGKQLNDFSMLETLPPLIEKETAPPDLACRKHLFPSCVDYTMDEVNEVLSLLLK